MKNIINNDSLARLKTYIEKTYVTNKYHHFAITDIHFNSNQRNPKLKIEISHCDSEKKIILIFNGFQFYLVSEESYTPHFDNKDFSGFSFISILYQYKFVDFLKEKGFEIQFQLRNKNIEDFFIFRVITQNYFIDIYTDELPEIIY